MLGERQKSGKIHAHTLDFDDMQRERSTGPFCLLFVYVSQCHHGQKQEGQSHLNKEDRHYRTINSWVYSSTLVDLRYHVFTFSDTSSWRKAKAINIRKFQQLDLRCSEHKLIRNLLNVRSYKSLQISMHGFGLLDVKSIQFAMANQSLYLGCSPCQLDLRRNNKVLRRRTSIECSECLIMEGISLT